MKIKKQYISVKFNKQCISFGGRNRDKGGESTVKCVGMRVKGAGTRVKVVGIRFKDVGNMIKASGSRVWVRVQGVGVRVCNQPGRRAQGGQGHRISGMYGEYGRGRREG